MANKKKVLTWLNNGCYPGYVLFSSGHTYKQLIKKLEKIGNEDSEWWLQGMNDEEDFEDSNYWACKREVTRPDGETKKLFYILLFKEFEFEDYDYTVLAHEILHICQFFLRDILDRDREIEAEAYYHTHLMTQCLKALRGK